MSFRCVALPIRRTKIGSHRSGKYKFSAFRIEPWYWVRDALGQDLCCCLTPPTIFYDVSQIHETNT